MPEHAGPTERVVLQLTDVLRGQAESLLQPLRNREVPTFAGPPKRGIVPHADLYTSKAEVISNPLGIPAPAIPASTWERLKVEAFHQCYKDMAHLLQIQF